jgi:hypothetical protein
MTLIDSSIFTAIDLQELLRVRWKAENRDEISPNVVGMIHRFEMISSWVATNVLLLTEPRERTSTLEFFIELAWVARKYRNYSLLVAVYTGIMMDPVQHQTEAWEHISERSRAHLDELNRLMSIRRNYREYRAELMSEAARNKPTIPYLGLVLKDLVAAEENMPDCTDDGLLNVEKFVVVGGILDRVRVAQLFIYRFARDPEIQAEIERITWISSEELETVCSRSPLRWWKQQHQRRVACVAVVRSSLVSKDAER